MTKFITIYDQAGVQYYINIHHIICVYRHNIGQTLIKIYNSDHIITELSMDEVIDRIQKQDP